MRNAMRMLALGVLAVGIALPASAGSDTKGQLFSGCLTGTDDNYVLRADDGTLYRLHSDKDLDEHVGHAVQVKGSVENKRRENEAQMSAGASQQAGVPIPTMGINVDDIKTLSHDCSQAGTTTGAGASTGTSGSTAMGSQSASSDRGMESDSSRVGVTGGSAVGSSAPAADVQLTPGTEHWVEGCMVGTDDYYVMRDQRGTLFRLHSDKDLDEHVGHVVRVKGKIEQNSRELQAQRVVDAARMADIDIPTYGINVNDVKTVSNTCQR